MSSGSPKGIDTYEKEFVGLKNELKTIEATLADIRAKDIPPLANSVANHFDGNYSTPTLDKSTSPGGKSIMRDSLAQRDHHHRQPLAARQERHKEWKKEQEEAMALAAQERVQVREKKINSDKRHDEHVCCETFSRLINIETQLSDLDPRTPGQCFWRRGLRGLKSMIFKK